MSSKQKDSTSKTVCIRQKQKFGLVVGTPTRRQRLLQPWDEIELFPGNADELFAALVEAEDKKAAGREAKRMAHREAERSKELRGCQTVLNAAAARSIRIDAGLIAQCENEPAFADSCGSIWFKQPPEFFLDRIFSPEDLVHVASVGVSAVLAYGDVRGSLSSYERIEPNPRRRGAVVPRKILVCRFANGGLNKKWRAASYIGRTHAARIALATIDPSTGALEIWYDVAAKSPEETTALLTEAIRLSADAATGFSQFLARIPNSLGQQWRKGFEELHGVGLLPKIETLRPRYLAVYWSPDTSLPTVPPKGRRA